jgi:hypothetical protein
MIDKSRIDKNHDGNKKGTIPNFTPVPRHYNRHDGWTPERQRGFIEALADTGSVRAAAHAVNMTPEGAYLLRRHPEAQGFRKAWEAALKLGVQRLEDVAMERALHGVEVPVYHFGAVVGSRRHYNDRLLMFMLRNRATKRFSADTWQRSDAPKLLDALVDAGVVARSTAIDSTYIKAQRAAFGGKGGARRKRSAVRAAAGRRRSTRSPTSSGVPMH